MRTQQCKSPVIYWNKKGSIYTQLWTMSSLFTGSRKFLITFRDGVWWRMNLVGISCARQYTFLQHISRTYHHYKNQREKTNTCLYRLCNFQMITKTFYQLLPIIVVSHKNLRNENYIWWAYGKSWWTFLSNNWRVMFIRIHINKGLLNTEGA